MPRPRPDPLPLAALHREAARRGYVIVKLPDPEPWGVCRYRGGPVVQSFEVPLQVQRFLEGEPVAVRTGT
jgi:hypothetical protein